MDVINVSCDRCEATATNTILWGAKRYAIDPGLTIQMHIQFAWCEVCNSFVTAEKLHDLNWYQEKVNAIIAENIFTKYRRDARQKLGELKFAYQWRANRSTSAKCLICGSERIHPLPFPARVGGTIHPMCGGTLKSTTSGNRLSIMYDPILFDKEGLRIKDSISVEIK